MLRLSLAKHNFVENYESSKCIFTSYLPRSSCHLANATSLEIAQQSSRNEKQLCKLFAQLLLYLWSLSLKPLPYKSLRIHKNKQRLIKYILVALKWYELQESRKLSCHQLRLTFESVPSPPFSHSRPLRWMSK